MITDMTSALTSLKALLDIFDVCGLTHQLHQNCLRSSNPDFKVCQIIIEQLKCQNSSKQTWIQKFRQTEFMADFIWEKLNTGHYSKVLPEYRQIYSLISMLKVIYLVHSALSSWYPIGIFFFFFFFFFFLKLYGIRVSCLQVDISCWIMF